MSDSGGEGTGRILLSVGAQMSQSERDRAAIDASRRIQRLLVRSMALPTIVASIGIINSRSPEGRWMAIVALHGIILIQSLVHWTQMARLKQMRGWLDAPSDSLPFRAFNLNIIGKSLAETLVIVTITDIIYAVVAARDQLLFIGLVIAVSAAQGMWLIVDTKLYLRAINRRMDREEQI
jgi:hypothetical protein